jgi:hypothetical protein
MANLISKADIILFWPMSLNMDDARIDPYVVRAEQNQLSSLIGPELYLALKTAFPWTPGDRFDKLFNGDVYKEGGAGNYEREYPGLKPLLAAYAFAYIMDNNPVHVTRGGVNRKAGDETENVPTSEVGNKSGSAYSEAIRLEGEFRRYISVVSAVYPEYFSQGPAKNSSFNFFNASRGCGRYEF